MRLSSTLVIFTILNGAGWCEAAQPVPAYHVIKSIPVPGDGGWDALTIDTWARRLYISHSTQVDILDIDQDKLAGQIPDTPGVHQIALAPDLGRGFASNGKDGTVTIFDLKTGKALDRVKVGGENPDAILYDTASRRVFVFNSKSANATALDAANGHGITSLPIGEHVDGAVFNPATLEAFFSNGDGTLTIIHEDSPDTYHVAANVKTQVGARTVALDEKTGRLYLATAQFGPPPAPTAEHPHQRPSIVPGTFTVLLVSPGVL
jgi:DNA-binding beta-propeller fold protein YncE